MMLGDTPTVVQRSPFSSSLSISTRVTALGAAVEDTHAVVDQLQALDVFLVLAEILAQRDVERVDGAVAFGRRDQMLAGDVDLDHRQRDGDALAVRIVALLDIDVELLDLEIIRHLAERAPRQQIERGVGGFVGVAGGLPLLQLLDQPRQLRIALLVGDAGAVELGDDVGAAGLVGHQHLAVIADQFRQHMLVGLRILQHRGGMNAGLGDEGALADIGRMPVRHAVEHVVERARHLDQGRELLGA